jgi:starvation-inducible DNA-binding protein
LAWIARLAESGGEDVVGAGAFFAQISQIFTCGGHRRQNPGGRQRILSNTQQTRGRYSHRILKKIPHVRLRMEEFRFMPTQTVPNVTRRSEAAKTASPDGFKPDQVKNLSSVLNALLADFFALYLKTKNFHWHMSGPHFRDYHLLLDEQSDQIFKVTDDIAERVRKIGGETIRSIGHIARLQRVVDNDYEFVPAHGMLEELAADNRALVHNLREAHEMAAGANDYATTSMIEGWIDEAERRAWFLFESTR